MIGDVFDLAAAYAIAIAQGRFFTDGNKRTAHQAMDVCLALNGVKTSFATEDIGQTIIRAARRLMDEGELAEWLRQRAAEEDHIVRMGLLASGAAHVLGTPLATISVVAKEMERELGQDTFVQRIQNSLHTAPLHTPSKTAQYLLHCAKVGRVDDVHRLRRAPRDNRRCHLDALARQQRRGPGGCLRHREQQDLVELGNAVFVPVSVKARKLETLTRHHTVDLEGAGPGAGRRTFMNFPTAS